jgi:hypothetical protein
LFNIIRTKHGHGLVYRRSYRFKEVQRNLLDFVEPSEDINNEVLARIGSNKCRYALTLLILDAMRKPNFIGFAKVIVNNL